jgi:hypothetical protein
MSENIIRENEFILSHCQFREGVVPQQPFKNIKWRNIYSKTFYYGVHCLLYSSLEKYNLAETLPSEIRNEFIKSIEETKIRSTIYFGEYQKLLAEAQKVGIPIVPIKGIFLSNNIYEHYYHRPFLDVDIFVQKSHLSPLLQIFNQLNYQLVDKLDRDPNATHIKFVKKLPFMEIEFAVHWNFLNCESLRRVIPIDTHLIWTEVEENKNQLLERWQFNLEMHLLYLCLHLAIGHQFGRLIWLVDIARFINVYEHRINWNYLLDKSEQLNVQGAVYYCLLFAKRMFSTPVPDHVLQQLKPGILINLLGSIMSESIILDQQRFLRVLRQRIFREIFKR